MKHVIIPKKICAFFGAAMVVVSLVLTYAPKTVMAQSSDPVLSPNCLACKHVTKACASEPGCSQP